MKRIICFLIIILFTISLQSQNREPAQVKFDVDNSLFGSDSVYISTDLDYFKLNSFMLGWHWGNGKKISDALRMNQAHSEKEFAQTFKDTVNIMLNIPSISASARSTDIMQAQAMIYEPTLKLDSANQFKPNLSDPSDSIFGFLN